MDVLIAYATKNGSTREVADFIAAVLRDAGAQVTLVPARSLRESIARYDLAVLGAPLYSGRWHADARKFLRRHRRDLAGGQLAIFGMGPRADTSEAWQRSRAQLRRALAKYPALAPSEIVVFGGVDPPGKSRRARRDLRDWSEIRGWANRLTGVASSPATRRPL